LDVSYSHLAIDDPHKVVKVIASDGKTGEQKDVSYTNCKVIGNGSFGVVFQAKLVGAPKDAEDIAIKKVLQDKRFKVRVSIPGCVFSELLSPVLCPCYILGPSLFLARVFVGLAQLYLCFHFALHPPFLEALNGCTHVPSFVLRTVNYRSCDFLDIQMSLT